MKNRKSKLFLCMLALASFCFTNIIQAQNNIKYQIPPKEITDLITANPTPSVSISPLGNFMLVLTRPSLPTIEEVSQPELGLAGLRINPLTNTPSNTSGFVGMKVKSLIDQKEYEIKNLPEKVKIENMSWSPDGEKFAFTIAKPNGLELWYFNTTDFTAKKLTEPVLNIFFRDNGYRWQADSKSVIIKSILSDRANPQKENLIPDGPVIQSNTGEKSPLRTFQDLLKNKYDESLFEYYATNQLIEITLDGVQKKLNIPAIIGSIQISSDGNYLLVSIIKKPYSYSVALNQFPTSFEIWDRNGKFIKQIADIPLTESLPKGFDAVRKGPRAFSWRNDKPATLYWTEAQDGGDGKVKTNIREKLFYIEAPFDKPAKASIVLSLRFGGIIWGNDNFAIVKEYFRTNRKEITSIFKPENQDTSKIVLFDRNSEDRYTDPGEFETTRNQFGRQVLLTNDKYKTLYLTGDGASNEGDKPFFDKFDVASKKSKRLWQSAAPYYEYVVSVLDLKKETLLTRRESKTEVPNYFIRNYKNQKLTQITQFANPYPGLEGITSELIQYVRKDGVKLSGKLYLPKGYKKENGPLPVLMWAYPVEFKSANAAGQINDSPYRFTFLNWASPLLWITQGYAILDDPTMPIIGEGDKEPNDTYIEQLVASAEAAINKIVEMGVADRNRIAVGGHSYGAFMTANLLAHSKLFAAGIARSGAYNRTLTPFGFQAEERSYWEARETYTKMSPFTFADKLKTPILLVHGGADNNPGTFTLQSERFYGALKGHGAIARLVILPKESHGYRAKESVLHMAWEMNEWLEKYVKNKK